MFELFASQSLPGCALHPQQISTPTDIPKSKRNALQTLHALSALSNYEDVLEDSEYLFVVSLRANGGDLAEFLDRRIPSLTRI